MPLIFQNVPSEADKLQAKGRLRRRSELSRAEQERLRDGTIYEIEPEMIDAHIHDSLKNKLRTITLISQKIKAP